MRSSKTLKRIRGGGLARCANLGNVIPPYIAHAARAGFVERRQFSSRLACQHPLKGTPGLRSPAPVGRGQAGQRQTPARFGPGKDKLREPTLCKPRQEHPVFRGQGDPISRIGRTHRIHRIRGGTHRR